MDWNGWGKRLAAHMRQERVTQEAVAEKMGVSQGAIAHWLSGRREINLSDFFRLCTVAGADPELILFGDLGESPKGRLLQALAGMGDKGQRDLLEHAELLLLRQKQDEFGPTVFEDDVRERHEVVRETQKRRRPVPR